MALNTPTFAELYAQVEHYLGCGSNPSASDIALAKRLVNQGYFYFLEAHPWSFLVQDSFLILKSGVFMLGLPDDFDKLESDFCFGSAYSDPPLVETTFQDIMHLRQIITGNGTPTKFAISNYEASTTKGMLKRIAVHPTPDAAYPLYYSYRFFAPKLVNDTDVPISGPRGAEAIRACCRAAAESDEGETIGPQWEIADRAIALAIQKDRADVPGNLGQYVGYRNGIDLSARQPGFLTINNDDPS